MSWYKRTPKVKQPIKQFPHTSSPMTEKVLKNVKESTKPKDKSPNKG